MTRPGILVPLKVCPTANIPVTVPATVKIFPEILANDAVAVVDEGIGWLLFNNVNVRISVMGYCASIVLARPR